MDPQGDILLHLRRDFATSWEAAMMKIQSSKCFEKLERDAQGRFVNAPPLYLASGLFNSTTSNDIYNLAYGNVSKEPTHQGPITASASMSHMERAAVVLRRLHAMGFSEIHTSLTLQPPEVGPTGVGDTNDNGDDVNEMHALSPEQEAWVDSLMSRGSECFVSAHLPSSFSYMVERMQLLDRGQVLKHVYITEERFGKSYEFRQWGVR